MKYAQVDIRQPAKYISGWIGNQPIYTEISNGSCIVDVQPETYPVGDPLFWVECSDDVQPWTWYYDAVSQTCIVLPPPAPKTAATDQPDVSGTQTV
jgi:hypothetical protein